MNKSKKNHHSKTNSQGEKKSFDPPVLIPYSMLCDLCETASEVKHLREEIKKLSNNQAALRFQFVELMEQFRELK